MVTQASARAERTGAGAPVRALDIAPRWVVPLLVVCVFLPRLLAFAVSENLYGDAVARMELAQRWAADPHLITSFHDGAQQYGPLHILLLGAALWVDPEPLRAGRWVSLLFGTLTVLPLFSLTRRLFGWRAAAWACVALAAWGVHLQCSVTAASEAVSLFWLIAALSFVQKAREPGRVMPLVWAALCMNVAAALRYDPWMLMPLVAVSFLFGAEDRAAGVTRAIFFGVLCLPFPLLWMHGNELATGDPLFPLRFTNEYHRVWAAQELSWMGQSAFRLRGLWFWPGAALFTLTPLFGLLGSLGMFDAYRRRPEVRWLAWLMIAPAAYYAVRQLVFADFVPLARFAVPQIALLLPFIAEGARVVSRRPGPVLISSAAVALGLLIALGAFTFDAEGEWPNTLRPVSPISRNPPTVRDIAERLEREARSGTGQVVLDADPGFWDLQLAAFSKVPEERILRVRWEELSQLRPGEVRWVVSAPNGELAKRGWRVTPERVELPDGTALHRRAGDGKTLELYAR